MVNGDKKVKISVYLSYIAKTISILRFYNFHSVLIFCIAFHKSESRKCKIIYFILNLFWWRSPAQVTIINNLKSLFNKKGKDLF